MMYMYMYTCKYYSGKNDFLMVMIIQYKVMKLSRSLYICLLFKHPRPLKSSFEIHDHIFHSWIELPVDIQNRYAKRTCMCPDGNCRFKGLELNYVRPDHYTSANMCHVFNRNTIKRKLRTCVSANMYIKYIGQSQLVLVKCLMPPMSISPVGLYKPYQPFNLDWKCQA